jgi:hypothetical protein
VVEGKQTKDNVRQKTKATKDDIWCLLYSNILPNTIYWYFMLSLFQYLIRDDKWCLLYSNTLQKTTNDVFSIPIPYKRRQMMSSLFNTLRLHNQYLRKDHIHGISSVLRVHIVKGQNIPTVGGEFVAKKPFKNTSDEK